MTLDQPSEHRVENAVALFWVLDPLQAFLGVDMIQGLQLQG